MGRWSWPLTYLPLTLNSWIDYHVYEITGRWHADSMVLDVLDRRPSPVNFFQRKTILDAGQAVAFVIGPGGVVCTAVNPPATLYVRETLAGHGESINNIGMAQDPPILICPADAPGIRRNGPSIITERLPTGAHRQFLFDWTSAVLHTGEPWGAWGDTKRTALREPTGQVYNYVYAEGVGTIDEWFGTLNSDETVTGYERYAVAWGGQ